MKCFTLFKDATLLQTITVFPRMEDGHNVTYVVPLGTKAIPGVYKEVTIPTVGNLEQSPVAEGAFVVKEVPDNDHDFLLHIMPQAKKGGVACYTFSHPQCVLGVGVCRMGPTMGYTVADEYLLALKVGDWVTIRVYGGEKNSGLSFKLEACEGHLCVKDLQYRIPSGRIDTPPFSQNGKATA